MNREMGSWLGGPTPFAAHELGATHAFNEDTGLEELWDDDDVHDDDDIVVFCIEALCMGLPWALYGY